MTQPEQEAREMLAEKAGMTAMAEWDRHGITPVIVDAMTSFAARPTAGVDRSTIARDIARVAGCQVGSERTARIVEYIASNFPTPAKTGERGAVIEECARVSLADAFEMGYAWRSMLTGQTLEDSRAVGRTLTSDTFLPIDRAIRAQIEARGFDSFQSADNGICDAKAIIIAALEALSQPLPDAPIVGGEG